MSRKEQRRRLQEKLLPLVVALEPERNEARARAITTMILGGGPRGGGPKGSSPSQAELTALVEDGEALAEKVKELGAVAAEVAARREQARSSWLAQLAEAAREPDLGADAATELLSRCVEVGNFWADGAMGHWATETGPTSVKLSVLFELENFPMRMVQVRRDHDLLSISASFTYDGGHFFCSRPSRRLNKPPPSH